MVSASSDPHLEMPEDANRLADDDVQPKTGAFEEPGDTQNGTARELIVLEPSKPPRKVSIVKAKRLARLHETAAVGLALGGLIVGYVAWRLSEGTISIAVAKPYVESALERIVGGQTNIGSLRLGWDKDRRDFVVTANQITATTDARTSPLALGQVNLTLNARALLSGQAQIKRADITGLQAVLVLDKEGRAAFGFGTPDEVLALPRNKRQTRGLRAILDDVRRAVLPQGDKGRVESIALQNAQLVIIDPDTGERLTLGNARANVTADANQIVTMQASGFAREMGGFGNIAVSASPDTKQRLVLAGVFEQAQLAKLPTSLRVGPLARFTSDTAPLSGDVLVHLGDQRTAYTVRGNLVLGQGRFQGIDVKSATGKVMMDGSTGDMSASNVTVTAAQGQLKSGTGSLSGLRNGLRNLAFDAAAFTFSDARLGNLSGDQVRGSAQLLADNGISSGSFSGRGLTFSRENLAFLQAKDVTAILRIPNPRQRQQMALKVLVQDLSGTLQGRSLIARGLDATIDGQRSDGGFAPFRISAIASRFAYVLEANDQSQDIDAKGVNLVASGFTNRNPNLPNFVAFTANEIALGGDNASMLSGRADTVAVQASNLASGAARLQASIANLVSDRALGRGYAVSGRAITLDALQTGPSSGQISNLQAQALGGRASGIQFDTTSLFASGSVDGLRFNNAKVSASSIEINHDTQLVRPFFAENLSFSGDLSAKSADLDAFSFQHRGVDLVGATKIALMPKGSPRVDLVADIGGAFSVETLLSAWPYRFLPETRENIRRLVPSGTAEVAHLTLAIPAGMRPKEILPKSAIDLDFDLRDVTVTYLAGMSPITNVSGRGQLTGNSLAIDLPRGTIGNIELSEGRVEIPEFRTSGAHALINATVSGAATDMAHEIDLPPLAILSKAQFDPARLSGAGVATMALDIPLKARLAPDDIGVNVSGAFQDAGLTRVFAGLDATNADVRLEVARNKVDVTGQAQLAGNLFDFVWGSTTSRNEPAQSQLSANGDVSIASLQALGFDIAAYASGPVRVDVTSSSQGSQFGTAEVNADFINTNISLPGKLWTKPEGVMAKASANLFPREGGGWNVQGLKFDSIETSLRGALDLSESGNLVDARFSRVVIPNAGDLAVNVTPGANGLTVTLRGDYLNLSPFLKTKNVSEQAVDLFDRPLTLSADINRVSTADNMSLTDVHADIIRDLEGWRNLSATGSSLAGKSEIRLLVERDGRRSVSGILSDAGFFAQLLYPGAPVFGGTGVIEGELPVVGANSSGILTFTGKNIQFARANAAPIMFENVQLPMSVRGGVVTLREGQADGSAYTVKANGYVDVGAGRLDLRGVATPGGLNRVLADIPVFGTILGGGADEGLLGLTFTAKGSLSAPRLITNPISALAPGFLRKLFESNIPISPQPRLVVTTFAGDPIVTKWPYGPSEDMSESGEALVYPQKIGPLQ